MGLFTCGIPAGSLPRLPPLNGVFGLVLPLAVAGCVAGAPNEVHKWVDQTLEKIGHTMGIQRALELIPKLEQLGGNYSDTQEESRRERKEIGGRECNEARQMIDKEHRGR